MPWPFKDKPGAEKKPKEEPSSEKKPGSTAEYFTASIKQLKKPKKEKKDEEELE